MRKMKDSGLEWIGEIPSDWDVTRIGYESWIRARLGWKGLKAEEYVDEGFAFLSAFNIVDDKLQWENLNFINQQRYDESPEIKLKKGDILLVKDGAGIGKCARIDSLPIGAATTNGSLAVISTHAKLSYRYLYFYLLSPIFQNYIYRLMNGMGVPHLSQEELRKIQIPFPPLDEQKRIADFLDAKCADIDQIRADIEKQIEILTDYKKSVITEAVTKGLDPKAKMKDSGIKWIGKIPEHWDVHPLYYYFGERKHKNVLGEEKNLLSISYGKIIRKNIDSKEGLLPENFNGYNIIEKDDIVMRLTDLQNDKRSLRTGLVKEHGIITSAYVTLKAKRDLSAVYFHYLLHCYDLLKVLYNMGNGVRQGLNFSELSRMMLIEPSIVEQKAIAVFLDEKCSEIDATIAEKQKQLETLEEYKKSLIFEYVTGKKEVV